ncbi:MAG: Grx4 family monothiol glutaredoxin [Candidatus Margulisiibacteriota bacterium]
MENLAAVKEQIKQDVKNNPVVLYMKGTKEAPMCGFSAQVVYILNQLGAEFITRDVLANDALRQAVKEYADWPTLPQLYVNGEFVGGCDIVSELYQSGDLQKLLGISN